MTNIIRLWDIFIFQYLMNFSTWKFVMSSWVLSLLLFRLYFLGSKMMKLTALLDNAMRNIFEEFPECSEGLETISSPFFFFFQKWYLAIVQKLVIVDSIFFPFFPFFPFPSGNCLKIILSTLSNIWPSSMPWLSGINRNVLYHIKQYLW